MGFASFILSLTLNFCLMGFFFFLVGWWMCAGYDQWKVPKCEAQGSDKQLEIKSFNDIFWWTTFE